MGEVLPETRSLRIGGLSVTLLPRGPYCARYTPATPVAGFAFESQRGRHAFASDRIREFYAPANGLAYTPEGCPIYSESAEGGEYLTLTAAESELGALAGGDQAAIACDRFTGRIDRSGIQAARQLRRQLLSGAPEVTAAELSAAAFLSAVARTGGAWQPPAKARSLTPRRLRTVEDLIAAHLAQPLTIGDMAEACGLSTGFFIRAFKAATGETPHRFLMSRRVAGARVLMRDRRLGIAEIALRSGFSSQAHMTVAFKSNLGITPGAYRASLGWRGVS